MYTQEETVYSEHSWNINNLPRCKVQRTQTAVPSFLRSGAIMCMHGTCALGLLSHAFCLFLVSSLQAFLDHFTHPFCLFLVTPLLAYSPE